MNLKDALKKAFTEKGVSLEIGQNKDRNRIILTLGAKGKKQAVAVTYGTSQGRKPTQIVEGRDKRNRTSLVSPPMLEKNEQDLKLPTHSVTTASVSKTTPIKKSPVVPKPLAKVRIGADAKCLVGIADKRTHELLKINVAFTGKESIDQIAKPEIREMAFGLDFGTSSVKVVIGDMAADKAYAVPFLKAQGIDAYLLPSRVFESSAIGMFGAHGFSLTSGDTSFRDLKLSLLANPDSVDLQVEVIAFLALVIQRARGWFFQTHASIYKRVRCLWQLRIGLPAATALKNKFVPLLENILRASWKVAAIKGDLDRKLIQQIRDDVFNQEGSDEDPEVRVIPEIAAQIFGFVASSSFDKKAANRYLMVDVGAGTVDASLFKVSPSRGGRWSFEFYTALVQPYGVSNLHAHRVDWWLSKLSEAHGASHLYEALSMTKFATDLGATLPVHNHEYFSGVELIDSDPGKADEEFFDKKLMAQVQGSTLWRAVKDGFLSKEQLKDIPMFLCGGGARSNFFLELEKKLQHYPGFSWLSIEPWQLGFPGDLEISDIDERDFDRLSVAYGLSKVDVGEITQAVPLPKVKLEPQESFTNRYIDKDQT